MILEVHGKKAEAYKNYQDFLTTDFSKTKEGLMIGCDYLILSQRYAEAADNYVVADQVMSAYEFEPNLAARQLLCGSEGLGAARGDADCRVV